MDPAILQQHMARTSEYTQKFLQLHRNYNSISAQLSLAQQLHGKKEQDIALEICKELLERLRTIETARLERVNRKSTLASVEVEIKKTPEAQRTKEQLKHLKTIDAEGVSYLIRISLEFISSIFFFIIFLVCIRSFSKILNISRPL
jgi:hypothetical protein